MVSLAILESTNCIFTGLLDRLFLCMVQREEIRNTSLKVAGHGKAGVAHAYLGHAVRAASDSGYCRKLNTNIIEDI